MIKNSLFDKKEIQQLFKADSYKETVVSELFFTPRFVYKIKKPVNLGFLNFKDKKERFQTTKYEFEVNKKFAPEIYVGLIPLKNKRGEVIEYAMKMRRLPKKGWLPLLLEKDKVSKKLAKKIAVAVVSGHAKLSSEKKDIRYGDPSVILKGIELVFSLLKKDASAFLTDKELKFIKKTSLSYFKKLVPEFKKRARDKRIQKIHGDLHSENIFIKNQTVYITDAILPIKEWANADVAYDLAAIAMDFDAYQKPELSKALIEEYSQRTNDLTINTALPFYKIRWAGVRLWVNAVIFKNGKKEAARKAQRYKNILLEYLRNN